VNFSDLWNYFSKENSVEWVYVTWTGSTVLGSRVYGTLIKRGPCTQMDARDYNAKGYVFPAVENKTGDRDLMNPRSNLVHRLCDEWPRSNMSNHYLLFQSTPFLSDRTVMGSSSPPRRLTPIGLGPTPWERREELGFSVYGAPIRTRFLPTAPE
jgi:hypothetical protein